MFCTCTLPETNSSPLKIGRNPKGNDRIPTIHFQVRKMLVLVRVFFINNNFFMQHLGPNCTTGDLCNITRHGSQMIYDFFSARVPLVTKLTKDAGEPSSTIEIGDDPSTSQQKQKLISSSQWFPKDLAALQKTRPLADFHRWSTEKSWCMKCWSKPVLSDTDPFHTSRARREVQPFRPRSGNDWVD